MKDMSTIIAKDHLEAFPHTWTMGLDYELVKCEGYIKLASNEGHINYKNSVSESVLHNFKKNTKYK